MPIEARPIAIRHNIAPYTHVESELECFPWNLSILFGTSDGVALSEVVPLLPTRREKTMYGPRLAKLYPRYDETEKPVDFHFLENYHYRTIQRQDLAPWENEIVWWPNIVVRLAEVYHVMNKIGENNPVGASKFFGFLSRPYVRLQEYWILIDDKKVGTPEDDLDRTQQWEEEMGDIDAAYESEDFYVKEALEVYEEAMGWDTIMKTPEDLIGVDNVETLSDRDKRRLRKVAQCLRSWGTRVPVVPRVVRWAKEGEGNHNMPPTIFDLADQLRPEQSYNSMGLRTFPDIEFR
ncbi:uncharacterized protein F4807DRAFT_443553 [Annulohypoxylon truncatum]|uniref:uncharacterized protein n=1 Tax=Annulohypoxylon truncatum TaxID=327061 RepID=UPI00200831A3|nr:uncharacterized protein F4807DRAFT_443553 [Annulohypoxylon truncatum]KAI1205311.1 hypothetical protein F4807DRAFT_443553 [Annulohypoxylon truncatum]